MLSRAAVPILKDAENPHILSLSPPLNLDPKWLGAHTGYTLAKYGMTMATLGLAAEFAKAGIAANTLWPRRRSRPPPCRTLLGGDAMMEVEPHARDLRGCRVRGAHQAGARVHRADADRRGRAAGCRHHRLLAATRRCRARPTSGCSPTSSWTDADVHGSAAGAVELCRLSGCCR